MKQIENKTKKPKPQTIFIYIHTYKQTNASAYPYTYSQTCISLSPEEGLIFPLHEKYIHLMITEEQWRKLLIENQDAFLEGKNKDITFLLKCLFL